MVGMKIIYRFSSTYLLDQINGGLEVKTKVNELPLDALPLVLLLLQDEHLQHGVKDLTHFDFSTFSK